MRDMAGLVGMLRAGCEIYLRATKKAADAFGGENGVVLAVAGKQLGDRFSGGDLLLVRVQG